MTDMPVANEAIFLDALGIDPNSVQKGSVHIQFADNSTPVITYTVMAAIEPRALGLAFVASSATEDTEDAEAPEGTDEPTPIRPPAKKVAKKRVQQ